MYINYIAYSSVSDVYTGSANQIDCNCRQTEAAETIEHRPLRCFAVRLALSERQELVNGAAELQKSMS
jgi:hypothetical protein